jgi:hypothetical protein
MQTKNFRVPSSGILRRVALVKTYVSEELSASLIIKVTRIGTLGTTMMREALSSSET